VISVYDDELIVQDFPTFVILINFKVLYFLTKLFNIVIYLMLSGYLEYLQDILEVFAEPPASFYLLITILIFNGHLGTSISNVRIHHP
jgi:hypothetical protein